MRRVAPGQLPGTARDRLERPNFVGAPVDAARGRARTGRHRPPSPPPPAASRVTFYERESFQGRWFTSNGAVDNFFRFGFNDRASSIMVERDDWQVCEDISYGGRCVVLREGRYPSLAAMGLNDSISSLRVLERYAARNGDGRYSPVPLTDSDYRR